FPGCRIRNGESGIHFLLNRDGRRRGDALIELESKADVQRALEKHLRYMGPRYVKVFEVHDKDVEGLLQNLRDESKAINDGVVMLRGLPYSCTEDDISDFFAGLSITDIAFVNRGDRRTGEAFVQFAAPDMAAKALLRHKEYIGNSTARLLCHAERSAEGARVSRSRLLALARREHNSVLGEEGGLSYMGGCSAQRETTLTRGLDACSAHGAFAASTGLYGEDTERSASEAGEASASQHFVHVRGFPTEASAQDLINFFAPLKPTRVLVEYNSHGEATGEADVHFESQEAAVAAMAKQES
ncbi:G-rich sequence factor 1, partial [Tinamus guttatus]